MMNLFQTNKNFRDCVFLFFLALVAYWPLSLNFLSLKNDALVLFTFRYHISEAIHHGYLPFWSPYIYTGFPMHADMQGAVWNPFVLVLSFIGKYDMTLLQWEVLIYLFLSAIGMYRLVKYLGLSRVTAICCATSFMCCGYMTDSISMIPWIPSAAFTPFVLLYFLRSLKSFLLSDAIKFSIALSLMFLCGYPSFFIFLNYIIATVFLLWVIDQIRNGNKKTALKVFGHFIVAYLVFILICSPAIISYYEFLPYYLRGSGLSYEKAISDSFVPFSLITYLLPNVANKASLPTDLAMRNAYTGLFIFLFFLISLKKLNRFQIIILAFTLFSFLFSLGDLTPVQKISYHFLPLMNTFRHPATMRVFTTVGIILLAAYSLNDFLKGAERKNFLKLCHASLLIIFASAVYFFIKDSHQLNQSGFLLSREALKEALSNLSFQRFALLICVLQIVFLLAFLFFYSRRFSRSAFILLFLFNSVVFACIALPFTVVSHYKTSEVDNYIHSFPAGFPAPDVNASIGSEVYSDSIQISPHGYANFFNKKITIQDHIINPTINNDYDTFLGNKALRLQLKDHPFVYVSNDSISVLPAEIKVLKFTPNKFSFRVNSTAEGKLQLFQQYNSNWRVAINNKATAVNKSNIAFMSVNIPAGTSFVEWKYEPKNVYAGMIISALSLLGVVFYFVLKRKMHR